MTSISVNADGARDVASRPMDHIVLHTVTELRAGRRVYSPGDICYYQRLYMINVCAKFEVPTFIRYGNTKGNSKMYKTG